RFGRRPFILIGSVALFALSIPAFIMINSNVLGLIFAGLLVLAENEGMIAQVTDYVIDEVFSDLGEFLARHPHLYVAINLSAA
ncbi:hypothetical protein, partial [Klebsiella oxytoca]|uniref:hypothetical protein n=1 Tax=Klebsiella oxytoca TaxID=571 RepID=UPI001C81BFD7